MASYSLGSAFDKNGTLMNYLYTDADFQTEDIKFLMALTQISIEQGAQLSLSVEQASALVGKVAPGMKIQIHGSSAKDISVAELEELQKHFYISGVLLKKDLSDLTYYHGESIYPPAAYKLCREKIDSIISELHLDDYNNNSNREQIIFAEIVKKLAYDISYDYASLNADSPDSQSCCRDMRGALLEGKTVCSGYADVLQQMLSCCNIESDVAIGVINSDVPGHIWNQVKLNGKWYNVDLTGARDSIVEGKEPHHMLLSNSEFFPRNLYTQIYYEKHKCAESMPSCEIVNMFYGDNAGKLLYATSQFAPEALQDFRTNYSYTQQRYIRPLGQELTKAEIEWEEMLQRTGKIKSPEQPTSAPQQSFESATMSKALLRQSINQTTSSGISQSAQTLIVTQQEIDNQIVMQQQVEQQVISPQSPIVGGRSRKITVNIDWSRNMTTKTKTMYSEVYSILHMLGKTYIDKVPKKIFNLIEKSRLETYHPEYNPMIDLKEQNVMKESLNMIALLYLRCWCESEDEKKEITRMFNENDVRYKFELQEKYSVEKLFDRRESQVNGNIDIENASNSLVIVEKTTILTKIINKIRMFFRFK